MSLETVAVLVAIGFFEPNSVLPVPPNRFARHTVKVPLGPKAQPILFSNFWSLGACRL